jgi:class 3 adenylate cyclase/tetratricopeptide (TPR) repeat protein
VNCPQCQTDNPHHARFCLNCGATLLPGCPHCGAHLPAGSRFCPNCGQPVAATGLQAPLSPSPPATQLQRYIPAELLARLEAARANSLMEGERRVVTILFCDVSGSTAAAAGLDPEEWAEIINGAFEHMIRPVYRYEGTVARLMGDGLLAFFGAPIAHEDDPQRAVLAGLEIVAATGEYGRQVNSRWGIDLAVRVGINTGLVVVGSVGSDLRMEYTALGDAINLAARMEQTASPGTVQITAATHRLLAPLFDVERLGELAIRGHQEPVTAYRVLRAKARPGSLRGLAGIRAPVVGRDTQLALLRRAVQDVQQGQGQIVALVGEAGLGKSRLIVELRREAAGSGTPELVWLEGAALSYERDTPYAAFKELFRTFLVLGSGSEAEPYARLKEQMVAAFPGGGERAAPFLATMLDITPAATDAERVQFLEPSQLRAALFAHVRDLLQELCRLRPVVLVLDDLHWADPTSLELLHLLLPLVEHGPLLLLIAFRPRLDDPSWHFHETAARDYPHHYQAVTLNPLPEDQARELLASLLHVEHLPDHVRQMILAKAEGNPFFVEEIIRSLVDGGVVIRENGHWRATGAVADFAIPGTLLGVITARLDRLSDESRLAVQAAAVLGRTFTPAALAAVLDAPLALDSVLAGPLERGLIVEKSSEPQSLYAFKHVLTQEAAYQSILLSNRRELHRRAAASLIALSPDQPAAIARHLLESRQLAQAMAYLVAAGDQAAGAYATAEAITFYTRALELQHEGAEPAIVRRAYEGLGDVLSFAGRIPEAQQSYQALLSLGETTADITMQISALNRLATLAALHQGDFREAETLLARGESLAAQRGETFGAVDRVLLRCQMCTAQGDFEAVVAQMGSVVALGETSGTAEQILTGIEHISTSLTYLLRFDEAKVEAEKALALARQLGDRAHEAWILAMPLASAAIRDGDFTAGRALLREALEIGGRIGAPIPQVTAAWKLSEIAFWQGEYEQALAYGHQAVEAALPLEPYSPFLLVPALATLGAIYLEIGDPFRAEVARFHQHALRLLENPVATITGGAAWADLGYCALALGDLELAHDVFQKGLNHPSMFVRMERARLLAGEALVASARDDQEQAASLVQAARAYASQHQQRQVMPLVTLSAGQIHAASGISAAALQAFARAAAAAQALGMRPILWQAHAGAASLLSAQGRMAEAAAQRAAAQTVVDEIGTLFQDETLRAVYLRSASARLA